MFCLGIALLLEYGDLNVLQTSLCMWETFPKEFLEIMNRSLQNFVKIFEKCLIGTGNHQWAMNTFYLVVMIILGL